MRLVRRPKATALDVIHYHDMQEALESSQAILETGPYAVEVTDKMILDLARNNIEQSQRMGFVQGDPAAIMMVEYAGDTEARGAGQGRGAGGAPRSASASATPPTSPTTPAEQQHHLEAAQGRARPAARHEGRREADRLRRGHRGRTRSTCPSSCRASARSSPSTTRDGAYYGHCSVGCLHIRPRHQPQDPARDRAGAGDRRGDHRPGARVRRRDLERARRRPRAQPLPGADVRPHAVCRPSASSSAAFDPDEPDEPRQHRGRARRHRAPPLRRPATRPGSPKTLLDFSAQGGFAAAVEMCNGVGRLPQEARGHDVPLLHGHPRRGALDPRPRQRAARGAVRARCRRPSSRASASTR